MNMLILGLLLWSVLHLFPALAPARREALVNRMGKNPYKGGFALFILGALALIILGWRAAGEGAGLDAVYIPPQWGLHATMGLMFVSFLLLTASDVKGNVRRAVRHPQLTGALFWAVAHLLANGELRSVVLFGGIGLWAGVEIFALNQRDGAWIRPASAPLSKDVQLALLTAFLFLAFALLHEIIIGVPVI